MYKEGNLHIVVIYRMPSIGTKSDRVRRGLQMRHDILSNKWELSSRSGKILAQNRIRLIMKKAKTNQSKKQVVKENVKNKHYTTRKHRRR